MLADSLPVLSEEAVAVGATWATERPLQTLEGWGWSTGQLASRHRVTAVERHGDRTVVSVSTEAEASLRLVEDPDKSGTLKEERSLDLRRHRRPLAVCVDRAGNGRRLPASAGRSSPPPADAHRAGPAVLACFNASHEAGAATGGQAGPSV